MNSEHDSATAGRSLSERLDSTAEAWKPDAGDKAIGTVIDVDWRTSEFGTYPIVTLSTDDGTEVAVHAFHTVLKSEFAKRPPRLGERLGIKYTGLSPKGYEGYRVVWEDVALPDWDRIAVEAEAEAAIEGVATGEPADDSGIPFQPARGLRREEETDHAALAAGEDTSRRRRATGDGGDSATSGDPSGKADRGGPPTGLDVPGAEAG